MGHRILALLLSAAALVFTQSVYALGLGEITLKSALNQPLNAEIQLLETRDLTESEILVGLASPEDFDRVGVDRLYFLTNLKFKVQLNGPKGPVILVTSADPVREPFVNFVLQAQWPSGRLLREYTLLMDLPVFSDEQSAPVAAPKAQTTSQQNQVARQTAPAQPSNYNPRSSYDQGRSASPQSSGYASDSQPSYGKDSYGPVKANDTLWEIAARVRPDRSVSIQQTMLAIQDLNPQAFINNNINLLRKGQVLRVPNREQIVGFSKQQAVSEVAVQNSQWSGSSQDVEPTGAQLDASRSISNNDETPTEAEGRVTLTSPEDVSGVSAGSGAGGDTTSIDALQNELAITLEQLDKTKRDNAEHQSHIASLEEQIATYERMIDVKNSELAALQRAAEKNKELAEQEQTADQTVSDGLEQETADDAASSMGSDDLTGGDSATETDGSELAVADGVESETATEESEAGETEATAPTAAEEVEAPAPTAAPTPTPRPKPKVIAPVKPAEKSIVDLILDNIIFIAAGLLALFAAAYLFVRFRSQDDEFEAETDEFLTASTFEEFDEEQAPEEDEIDLGVDQEDGSESADLEEPDEVEEPAGEAQTEDAVAEADIYIAYGKYDQAEEMLIKALNEDGADAEARVKLLEVYAAQQDVEKFDPQYATLRLMENESAVERGKQLRETILDAQPFDESLYDVSAEAAELLGGDNVDTSLSDLDSQLDSDTAGDFDALNLDLEESSDAPVDDALDFEIDIEPTADAASEESGDGSLEISDFEFELDTDSSDGVIEDPASLELDIEDSGELELSVDDFDLDFDAGAETEDSETSEELPVTGFEDLGVDDSLELTSDDGDTVEFESELDGLDVDFESPTEDAKEESLELEAEVDSTNEGSDFDDFDFSDLDSALDDADSGEEVLGQLDADLSEDALELGDEDTEGSLEAGEFESSLELEIEPEPAAGDDLAADFDLEPELKQEPDQEPVQEPDIEDLSLTGELDLSALDQELDELTTDLSIEEADIDSLELAAPPEEESADVSDILETPTVMEEPMTDFDDFDVELEPSKVADGFEEEPVSAPEQPVLEESIDEDDAGMGDDALFNEALADVSESDLEFSIPEIDPESDDDDLAFLSDSDETATKLDLARAYIDMGDADGAKDILQEIVKEGNAQQVQEAENLLSKV